MGNDQSNRPPHDIQRTMSSMTFDQLLSTVSQKVSKLQEVLSNMKEDRTKKGERVPEFQAAKYLAEELGTAESELSKYKVDIKLDVDIIFTL